MARMRAFLKSPTFKRYYNVPMRFIPQFKRGQGDMYNNKHEKAVQKHMKITTFGVKTANTVDLRDIDSPCDLLDGSPTGRQLILGLKLRPPPPTPMDTATDAPSDPQDIVPASLRPARRSTSTRNTDKRKQQPRSDNLPLPVFLSIDRSERCGERGTYVVSFTQSNAVEAEEKLRYLLTYLKHAHGNAAVSLWFTQDACDRAEDVIWDEDTDRPISKDELELDSLLDDDVDWIDDLDDTRLQFENAKVPIEIERPKRFQQIQSNPLEGDAESITTFYKTSDLPALDGDNGDAPPVIGGLTRAGDSRESSAPLAA